MALLDQITGPADVRDLPADQLPALANEIRQFLVLTVRATGGHLGPNLGVVELTIALHRVFDSPHDPIIWDTGHQAYVHKLLTGRGKDFPTLRQRNGLSGYPCRAESPHDLVENSHASTALSHADGLSKAAALTCRQANTVVAVVGDGAMTGGMCWEALQNLGARRNAPVVIVLNDNGRSYSPTCGGFARHLARLRAGESPGESLFELLGLDYLGPVDGHDVEAVQTALEKARRCRSPVVVHCVTDKGHGYPPAEQDEADHLHAIAPAAPPSHSGQPTPPSWTSIFGRQLCQLAARRPDLVAVTAAMPGPTGLAALSQRYPDRVFDVGIAEQHAVTSAAGLALGGMHPVVAVYSTFLCRAFDQALMDVALHRLPVTFVLDRAGVTGPDGSSHHGVWDLALLRVVPGIRIAAPRDGTTLVDTLTTAVETDTGPTVVRFPKGTPGTDLVPACRRPGFDLLREGEDVLIVSVGPMARRALAAAEELQAHQLAVAVVDPVWVLPVCREVLALARRYPLVVVVEDGNRASGVGSALAEALGVGTGVRVLLLGVPGEFAPAGAREQVLDGFGLSPHSIATTVLASLASIGSSGPCLNTARAGRTGAASAWQLGRGSVR
ncbi:1-deoxy-D-xylulose-5-phosphate synthase [Kutzneria viridogrisea]|uniref:1-deoxy-D-xylulose-5-phosphate synthase n=2 Tax=Kutzneria TaxID=43356 RepID=W5W9G6_9PSEU|nr:1-deoxy-D-xylulose-5-phosphate synthase [Kutzneria albida]AHH97400.1 hypothetical protein KALB_4036 [Kutzneria albida DSM 43870]MBA8930681.1 1-deoxy-D-xylulose-5-phosphate synthase [Kutzneria viridogrisea]